MRENCFENLASDWVNSGLFVDKNNFRKKKKKKNKNKQKKT